MSTPIVSLYDRDIADWSDEELTRLKDQAERRQKNYERIVRENLKDGVHYGLFSDDGEPDAALAPQHPYLYPGGAARLRELLRLTYRQQRDPMVVLDPTVSAVTLEVGVYSLGGRLLGVAPGHANSREAWLRRGPKDWKYEDAREVVPGLITKATRRGARNATLEALNLTASFASAEEHQRMYAEAPVPKDFKRWSPEDRRRAKDLSKLLGMDTAALLRKVVYHFGRPMVGAGEEAKYLLDLLEREVERKTRPENRELPTEAAA